MRATILKNMDQYSTLLMFAGIGFLAQMIDGGLGMGFGISSNTLLMSMGIPPAVSSASVHIAEIFTSGVAGTFHWRAGNVDRKLFWNLVIPGMFGGAAGALLLSRIDGHAIKPIIAVYLFVLGFFIVRKAFFRTREEDHANRFYPIRTIARHISRAWDWLIPHNGDLSPRFVRVLGGAGSFLDAIGGGGWGPVVTSTLVVKDQSPRHSIGTASASEFFITSVTSIVFLLTIGFTTGWQVVIGLLIGGGAAAPLAAIVCKKIPPRVLMMIVGILIVGLSCWTLWLSVSEFLPLDFCVTIG